MSRWTRGAVACAAAALALTGCSGDPVEVSGPAPAGAAAEACQALVDAVPDTPGDQERREVEGDGIGAAWGDPPVVLSCGVGVPEGFDEFSTCLEVDGVGWFVPPEQEADLSVDVLLTAVGFEPRVSLLVPVELRGGPSAALLTELAAPMKETLELVDACA